MSTRRPLVIASGVVQQLPAADSILIGTSHVVSTDTTIAADSSVTVNRYVRIASGVVLTIGSGADLEIT